MPISADHTRIAKPSLADYLAVMTRAVFQGGLSWAAIDSQWEALRESFDDFDIAEVARYRTPDIERLMTTDGILHSKRKIEATIKNAATILELDKEYKGFRNYLRSLRSYEELTADLKRRFKFVGAISAYYFLYRVGEEVPPFKQWIKTVEGDHPRIEEMVGEQKSKAVKK
ncbi:MAG TPA: DNA-3-methyladenine glycosylase I [Candidatus Eremiobacteraceae bacterium]|nr:DNA-3-methyladenine glycosylase I [Candidatus Eremiobacteraceae bacterium]